MTALEKAERDLGRGDYWLARCRLTSYLTTKGYDAQIVARIGRISQEMHDDFAAGAMWLVSTEEGEEVDRAIDTFLAHAGKDPHQVVGHLPGVARGAGFANLPEPVRARLRRFGLDECMAAFDSSTNKESAMTWVEKLLLFGLCLFGLFCIVCCCAGFYQIISWALGGD